MKIRYVGKKPFAFDNVAQSGKIWAGHGDVQEVSDAQARKLLGYPDQWALDDPKSAKELAVVHPVITTDEQGQPVELDPAELLKPIERMSKIELVALAQSMGKSLPTTMARKGMIDQITLWRESLGLERNR